MGSETSETHDHYDADGNFTGRTVVTREPEWDDEQRDIALELADYRRNVHHACGTHISKAMDDTVLRDVGVTKVVCLDCKRIDEARKAFHAANRHTEATCDCDDRIFYISGYRPKPLPEVSDGGT